MNQKLIFEENKQMIDKINSTFNENFLELNSTIEVIEEVLEDYNNKIYDKKFLNKKEIVKILNILLKKLANYFSTCKSINECIINRNMDIEIKFKELKSKFGNVPSLDNPINTNIAISTVANKYLNYILNKYNLGREIKIYRKVDKDILNKEDKELYEYVELILQLDYVEYMYNELSNILININCNYLIINNSID